VSLTWHDIIYTNDAVQTSSKSEFLAIML